MLKHIGRHGDKKIVLLFREVPEESHMCLLVYSDLLPRTYHDEIMRLVESPSGQDAQSFSDVLHRSTFADGSNCLLTLHKSGWIKKVRSDQIKMTPNSRSSVMLNELNKILNEMNAGDAAKRQMEDIKKGVKTTTQAPIREVGMPAASVPIDSAEGVLTDSDLARDRLRQAERMRADAARLLTEAENLTNEAIQLDPTITNDNKSTKKKTASKAKKD